MVGRVRAFGLFRAGVPYFGSATQAKMPATFAGGAIWLSTALPAGITRNQDAVDTRCCSHTGNTVRAAQG
jgi:hypothetical protein